MNKHWVLEMVLVALLLPLSGLYAVPPKSASQIEQEIHALVNQYRKKKGLNELKYLDGVAAEAATHSSRMARRIVPLGHSGFDDRFDRLHKKYPKMTGCAENVAYSARDADAVVAMWLHSSGHKKNIKGKYTHTGIAVVSGKKGVLYYTQLFVRME